MIFFHYETFISQTLQHETLRFSKWFCCHVLYEELFRPALNLEKDAIGLQSATVQNSDSTAEGAACFYDLCCENP
jgi:hypothetical protein